MEKPALLEIAAATADRAGDDLKDPEHCLLHRLSPIAVPGIRTLRRNANAP
jgi:hypothetical protein